MAAAVPAELSQAKYYCPIHASQNPTPAKPPFQKAQHSVTQVPRSPSLSQRTVPDHLSQKDSESIVHDSLEYRPPAPAPPPIPVFDFLEQSVPINNGQLERDSYDEKAISLNPPAQSPVVTQSPVEAPSHEHPPSEHHTIEEDPIQLPPKDRSLPEKDATSKDPGKTQLPISFQNHAVSAKQTLAQRPVYTESDDDEKIQDCITIRSQPATAPIEPEATRTPLARSAFSQPNVTAITGLVAPSMSPKASTTKPTTHASQTRKSASTTSRKSSKPAASLPDIVNQGETSAVAILRQRKSGGTSQTNTTRQASEVEPAAVPRSRASQNNSARQSQAPVKKSVVKSTTKPAQQRQTQPQRLSIKQPSRRIEAPEGRSEFSMSPDVVDQPAELQRPEKEKSKPTKPTRTVAPSKKGSKSQSKNKVTKAADTDEDDDEDYTPKAYKSAGATTTRAKTRARTQKANKDDGLNLSIQDMTTSDAPQMEKHASRKPASSDREEIEDFEDSVTHINSGGAAGPRNASQAQPAKPAAVEEAKPRRRTDKSTQLMAAIFSPDRATNATATEPKTRKEVPATQPHSSSAYQPVPEQGTTQRNPVNINDDVSNEDCEDAANEGFDASFDQISNEVMSQKPREKDKSSLIEEQILSSLNANAHESPVRQTPARLSFDLDALVPERDLRKPKLAGFNNTGPRNQGSRRKKRPSSVGIHDPPFEGAPSSDIDQPNNLQEPPAFYSAGPAVQTKKASRLDVAESSAHTDAVVSSPYKTLEDVFGSKQQPPTGQPRKLASIEISSVKGKECRGSEFALEAVAIDDRHTNTRSARSAADDKPLVVDQIAVELEAQPALPESLGKDPSRQLFKKPEVSDGKLREITVTTNSLAPPGKPKPSIESDGSRDLASVSSKRPVPTSSHTPTLPTPGDTQAPSHVAQPRRIDRPSGMRTGRPTIPPVQEDRLRVTKLHPEGIHTKPPEDDRKRSSAEMTSEPAKRPRTSTQNPRTQPTGSPAAKRSVFRRPSQIADNGSPIPYGVEIPQETADPLRTRDEKMSTASIPPPILTDRPMDVQFARITRSKHKEPASSESPLKEMDALQQKLPAQISPAVTHAGFDEDTQATTEYTQLFESKKIFLEDTISAPQERPPQMPHAVQRTLGLMEALRSEVVPHTSAQEADGNDVEHTEVNEARDEEDADKTLVNEDSDDDEKSESNLSMWRKTLEPHQRDVYDQLVRIAHRLTEHLKDHETAIKDISTDYKQDGAKLIDRLEKDNEVRLEQYCIKQSKVQGALMSRYERLSSSVEKDKKEIKASRERHVKMLQRQVDAEGRLEQLLQTYHL